MPPLAWQSKQATPRLGLIGAPILGLVELLLRKRRQQQTQALNLLRIQNAVEHLVEVSMVTSLPLRNVAQVRPGGQIDGGGKLRKKVFREIEIEVEAR